MRWVKEPLPETPTETEQGRSEPQPLSQPPWLPLAFIGAVAGVQQSVEDQERRLLARRFLAQQVHHRRETLVEQRPEHADIGNAIPQVALIEERQRGK